MNKVIATLLLSMVVSYSFSVTINNMPLNQEVNTNSIEAINSSMDSVSGTLVIKSKDTNTNRLERIKSTNGVTIDIYEDGELKLYFENELNSKAPMDRITVNDVSISKLVEQMIDHKMSMSSPSSISNTISEMVYNPLWGKKLAVVGDSLTEAPSKAQSWPEFIRRRNNMTLVHAGQGGKKLCSGTESNPSLISSYTNSIPRDSDFILIQIGANDSGGQWKMDEELETPVPDDDMSLTTFKGCWNNLLIGVKTNYPNAKIGIILANNWSNNVGSNSEDVVVSGYLRNMTQWQKMQCQKLNIPVLDPVQDTRFMTYFYHSYTTNGTTITPLKIETSELNWYDRTKRLIGTENSTYSNGRWIFQSQYITDTWHTSEKGNILLSFFYEQWMKTVLMCN